MATLPGLSTMSMSTDMRLGALCVPGVYTCGSRPDAIGTNVSKFMHHLKMIRNTCKTAQKLSLGR